MDSMGIGALAKHPGVGIDTVRYYERRGLLPAMARLASGYRRYGTVEILRLRFIRRAQALGFTLREIRELLALWKRRDVPGVKQTAQEKLANLEQRIRDLDRVRRGLRKLIAACPGQGRAEDCPILKALGAEDSP